MALTDTLPKDANNVALQEASDYQMHDGAVSPIVSPITTAATNIVLTWPNNSVELLVKTGANMVLTETAGGGTVTILANSWFAIAGKPGNVTTIPRSSGACDFV